TRVSETLNVSIDDLARIGPPSRRRKKEMHSKAGRYAPAGHRRAPSPRRNTLAARAIPTGSNIDLLKNPGNNLIHLDRWGEARHPRAEKEVRMTSTRSTADTPSFDRGGVAHGSHLLRRSPQRKRGINTIPRLRCGLR